MSMRISRLSLVALATLVLTAGRAWAMEEILGQTKEELKLKYEVTVQDHGTGRVTVVLTIADEGRLKPVQSVDLMIPMEKGQGSVDLMVSLDAREVDGTRVARVHLKKEWAQRAQIWLKTSTFDGKQLLERSIHPIPLADHMKNASAAPATQRALAPDERRAVEIARRAVAANDTWVERATFDPKRDGDGWTVDVERQPAVPGGHRFVRINARGEVVDYVRGR